MSLSLYDLFVSMGLFAKSIVIILAAMSIYSWTSAFQKLYQIVRSQGETRRFAPEFSRFLQEEQLDGAIKLAEKQKKRSEEHTSELQSPCNLVCRLLLEKKKKKT